MAVIKFRRDTILKTPETVMKSDLVDISVQFQHQTDDAFCVRAVEDGPDIWVPKSQCEIEQTEPRRGYYVLLTTDETTATEKGLV